MGISYTIPPFSDISKLPACAVQCQPLWDANGGCVPPAISPADPKVYGQCFCANAKLAPFATAAAGVCDNACAGDPKGLSSIAGWFVNFCDIKPDITPKTSNLPLATGATPPGNIGISNANDGDWLSNHWKWVIMLVILVVGIAGIWIGACIWRRRYLRKRDRQTSLGQKHSGSASNPSWGPTVTGSQSATAMTIPPAVSGAAGNEKGKQTKKWTVNQRT